MTEKDIQEAIFKNFTESKNHPLAVPNCKALYPRGESDLISVTPAGLVHEFEIKRSTSDFKREFKSKSYKHEILEESSQVEGKCTPNYFWFAMPRSVQASVPEYAGEIRVGPFEEVKAAPRRHSGHITDRARKYLERGVTKRYWQMRK